MINKFYKWIRKTYNVVTGSIAFYPAVIAICFLILSWLMLELDFSEPGKQIKNQLNLVRLRDASTARTIVSTISAGILSLTVFSFSMVMIVLNQTASQMSNRTLESMISNRFQQIILGIYIGSIVYALFLLSSIRDIDSGIYVPAISIYLLLLLTVTDIFLFIYFLHYVTQSVKYETIIKRIHHQTLSSLEKLCIEEPETMVTPSQPTKQVILMPKSNYLQGFDEKELVKFARHHSATIEFLYPFGTYLLEDMPLLHFYSNSPLSEKDIEALMLKIDFFTGQPVEKNAFFGFHQLAEVGIKALSPGINDPGTAVISLHALADLFLYKQKHCFKTQFCDAEGVVRAIIREWTFEALFAECFYPLWDYGKKDRYVQNAFLKMMMQLESAVAASPRSEYLTTFIFAIRKQIDNTSW